MKPPMLCPNCENSALEPFYEGSGAPVHSVLLLDSHAEAVNFPRRDIQLGFCHRCGFISNIIFDPEVHQYSERYEATQGYSSTFNAFHKRLALQLIERYDLRDKTILEIGCDKGEFLSLLCELGPNRGIGVDPAYVPGRLESPALERMQFVQDFYSEKYSHLDADFYCCKMTLEHIPDTARFMNTVRDAIGDRPDAVVFFQIPEVTRVLCEVAFWDIYYEHCSYFSRGSLARLFRGAGFDVLDLWTDYDNQYLMIEARPTQAGRPTSPLPVENDLGEVERDVEFFATQLPQRLQFWRERLDAWRAQNRRVVLWGAGSKAVSFLTTLGIGEEIQYGVDINPHKHGTFLAGTGQQIIPPGFLQEYKPDVVILMNPVYFNEVQTELTAMNLHPEIVSITDHANH